MKKYDLLRNEETIVRVLEIKSDTILIIDCIKKTMPVWVKPSALDSFSSCTDKELNEITGFTISDIDILDAHQKEGMSSNLCKLNHKRLSYFSKRAGMSSNLCK